MTLPETVEHISPCTCAAFGHDSLAEEVARVAHLQTVGVPLREACLLVWGDGRVAHRAAIRQSFRDRWPDLELPDWRLI